MDFSEAFSQLEKQNYFVWDDFISEIEVQAVLVDYDRRSEQFKRAGIGQGNEHHIQDQIRTDAVDWFEPLDLSPAQALLWNRFEVLKEQINEHLFLGLWNLEGHYSNYKIGGHYQKHVDRFSKDDTRTLSLVLYLNTEWEPSQGGELQLHPQGLPTVTVSPIAGRLVCFLSADLLHEVLPTLQERKSFTAWYKRRAWIYACPSEK